MIIDTHAHYDDEAFDEDRKELLFGLKNKNIDYVVNIAANLKGCHDTLELTREYDFVFGALGIHPDGIMELNNENMHELEETIKDNAIYNGKKIVAVGEIGLDYYYPDPPRLLQKKWFDYQLQMAKRVKLPVNIHSRDACKDTLDILRGHKAEDIGGIIHCYSYSRESAREFLDMGFYFGIGGVVTFKNAKKLVEAVEYIPINNIVLETDAPYLSPVPLRGKRNDSSNLEFVVEMIAEIKNISREEVALITSNNSRKVYGLDAYIR